MKFTGKDDITLSSGRTFYCFSGMIGIGEKGEGGPLTIGLWLRWRDRNG